MSSDLADGGPCDRFTSRHGNELEGLFRDRLSGANSLWTCDSSQLVAAVSKLLTIGANNTVGQQLVPIDDGYNGSDSGRARGREFISWLTFNRRPSNGSSCPSSAGWQLKETHLIHHLQSPSNRHDASDSSTGHHLTTVAIIGSHDRWVTGHWPLVTWWVFLNICLFLLKAIVTFGLYTLIIRRLKCQSDADANFGCSNGQPGTHSPVGWVENYCTE